MKSVLVGLLLLGCSDSPSDAPDAAAGADARPASDASGSFRDCRNVEFPPAPVEDWRNASTSLLVASGSPNHSAQDVIAPLGPTTLPGKFSYGTFGKDLEDEDVRVFLYDCSTWRDLGIFTTDADGRIAAPLAAPPDYGVFEVKHQVLGDQSLATSYLWVLPAGTRLVVTDIDGTMTRSDRELFQAMYDGSHVPEAYPSAPELTRAHRDDGYVVFYMTGRPYWLTEHTRGWLRDLGFTAGPLRVTDSEGDSVPSESGVGDFKMGVLEGHLANGYQLDFAYGNATTDIYAYLGAGLPADRVWIIGDHAGEQGTHAVTDTWAPRLAEVEAMPAVTQPFRW